MTDRAKDEVQLSWLNTRGHCYLVFAGAIIWALLANRFGVASGHMIFLEAAEAMSIASGKGMNITANPPGFPLLVSAFVYCGMFPLYAAWLVSLSSFAGVCTMTFLSAQRMTNTLGAYLAAGLVLLNRPLLWMANTADPDMSFTCFCFLALIFLAGNFFSSSEPAHDESREFDLARRLQPVLQPTSWRGAIEASLVGLLLALPFWLKYSGIFIAIIGVVALATVSYKSRKLSLRVVLSLFFLVSPDCFLVVRNIALTGSLTAHHTDAPGPPFFYEYVQAMNVVANDWVEPFGRIVYWPWKVMVATMLCAALLGLAKLLCANSLGKFIAIFVVLYPPFFCLLASTARVDMINSRYLAPIYPGIAIAIVLLLHRYWPPHMHRRFHLLTQAVLIFVALNLTAEAMKHFRWNYIRSPANHSVELALVTAGVALAIVLIGGSNLFAVKIIALFTADKVTESRSQAPLSTSVLHRAASVIALLIVLFGIEQGGLTITSGLQSRLSLAPATMSYLLKHAPPGSTVAGNRAAQELVLHSSDYTYLNIPFADPWNENQNSAMGVKTWTRVTGLAELAKNRVRFLAICSGATAGDPILAGGYYGQYVDCLVRQSVPEVKAVTRLDDGVVVELAGEQQLMRLLGALQTNPSATHD